MTPDGPAHISVQLYSVRERLPSDVGGTLRELASIGYVGVEPAGLYGYSPAEFKTLVDDAGLLISSAHTDLPVGDQAGQVLDEQASLGNKLLVSGLRAEDFASIDNVKRSAQLFSEAAENAARMEMTVGYHNHWWEFESKLGGRPAYEWFLELTDPRVVAQLDIYWVQVAGLDPAEVLRGLGPRALTVHVKDGPCIKGVPQTAVGAGIVDIAATLRANPAPAWHIVELDDCATDMLSALANSYQYLTQHGLSRGKARLG